MKLLDEIIERYPIVYEKLKKYCDINYHGHLITVNDNKIELENKESHAVLEITFSMLYGLLEDFFEDNGIIIQINYKGIYGWGFDIYNQDKRYQDIYQIKTKRDARENAIIKSCKMIK